MRNKVAIFKSVQFGQVRTINEEGKILFCGKDIAAALGYAIPRKAIYNHCREKGVLKRNTPTNGGMQTLLFIDEGNLYRLITHSKLPEAEKFESWVFDEILPSIRQTGSYNAREKWREQRAENARMRAETARINANTRQAQLLMKLAEKEQSEQMKNVKEILSKFVRAVTDLAMIVDDIDEQKKEIGQLLDVKALPNKKTDRGQK